MPRLELPSLYPSPGLLPKSHSFGEVACKLKNANWPLALVANVTVFELLKIGGYLLASRVRNVPDWPIHSQLG